MVVDESLKRLIGWMNVPQRTESQEGVGKHKEKERKQRERAREREREREDCVSTAMAAAAPPKLERPCPARLDLAS